MGLETSAHRISIVPLDDHEARAKQLEAVGRHRQAERVRACRAVNSLYPNHTCKVRGCPSCAAYRAGKDAKAIAADIRKMTHPQFYLATLPSGSLQDLGSAISSIRNALRELRRLKVFKGVVHVVGAIEPKLADCEHVWAVHAHLILDVKDLDRLEIDRAWRRLTDQRGQFKAHPHKVAINKSNATLIAGYVAKSDDWCPTASDIDPETLDALLDGTKNKRHLIRWHSRSR